MSKTIVFDIEIFNNCALVMGRVVENRRLIKIWLDEPDALTQLRDLFSSGCTFVSFNGINFDTPVIAAMLAGFSQDRCKLVANTIINQELKHFQTYKKFKLKPPEFDQIDLLEVVPGFVSLKCYMGRMHMPWLKDLPFPHDAIIEDSQREMVERYCENDLDGTEALFHKMKEPLLIRLKLSKANNVDLRSKSEAQMAETLTIKELGITDHPKHKDHANYKRASFIHPKSQLIEDLISKIEDHTFLINPKTGKFIFPEFLKAPFVIGTGKYQMGVGGLHSKHDKKLCLVESKKSLLIKDFDINSAYPNGILNAGIAPSGGQKFLDMYRGFLNDRLQAKEESGKLKALIKNAEGEELKRLEQELSVVQHKADVGKLFCNSLFGKLGSSFSKLYSPDLMLAVTIGGQLYLLCLIERIVDAGGEIVSANTDGIVVKADPETMKQIQTLVANYGEETNFVFEETSYRTYAAKDCNNYFAIKQDRSVKAKGIYAPVTLSKNPTAPICSTAVSKWLAFGTDFMDTIRTAEFHEFISVRSANKEGGGGQGDEALGRVVRWYYTTDKTLPPISYIENGNKVAKSDGARACMVMKDKINHPDDLDYMWYYMESLKIAKAVGCEEFLTDEQIRLITPPPKVRKPRVKKG